MAAVDREAWDEFEQLFAPDVSVESRRKIVGFTQIDVPSDEWIRETRRDLETGDHAGQPLSLSPCEASAWLSLEWRWALPM